MRKPILYILSSLAMLAALSLPAQEAFAQRYRCNNCGTVERVERIRYDQSRYDYRGRDDRSNRDSGTEGMIIGALIGGALGNQVGGGSGRTAATVAGAVAGGAVGRNIDRNNDNDRYDRNYNRSGTRNGVRLRVRMDQGGYQTVEVAGNLSVYRGDRVRLRNDRVELLR